MKFQKHWTCKIFYSVLWLNNLALCLATSEQLMKIEMDIARQIADTLKIRDVLSGKLEKHGKLWDKSHVWAKGKKESWDEHLFLELSLSSVVFLENEAQIPDLFFKRICMPCFYLDHSIGSLSERLNSWVTFMGITCHLFHSIQRPKDSNLEQAISASKRLFFRHTTVFLRLWKKQS